MKFNEVAKGESIKQIWKDIEVPPIPDGYKWRIYFGDPAIQGPKLDFPVAWVNVYSLSPGYEFEMTRASFIRSSKLELPAKVRMVGATAEEVINALALKVWTGEYSE